MQSTVVRLRGWSGSHIATWSLIAPPIFLLALIFLISSNIVAALICCLVAVGLSVLIYLLWFRPLAISDTEVSIPTGFVSTYRMPMAEITKVGLLFRHNGKEKNSPGWVLELTNSEGRHVECTGFFTELGGIQIRRPGHNRRDRHQGGDNPRSAGDPLKHKLPQTRPGRVATSIYEQVSKHQGPGGPLHCQDSVTNRSWIRSGRREQLGWWSPDGRLLLLGST